MRDSWRLLLLDVDAVRRLAVVVLLLLLFTVSAGGGSWFESLKQPETGVSCCDTSDCRATRAEYRTGQWWAEVLGRMTPIPSNKVLKTPLSFDGDAYVCASPHGAIYCFVPPPSSF